LNFGHLLYPPDKIYLSQKRPLCAFILNHKRAAITRAKTAKNRQSSQKTGLIQAGRVFPFGYCKPCSGVV
jgi:hypothetical protein